MAAAVRLSDLRGRKAKIGYYSSVSSISQHLRVYYYRVFGCGISGLGWIQLSIWGTEPTHPLFGCSSDFGDGVNPSHVWLRELGVRVGWQHSLR